MRRLLALLAIAASFALTVVVLDRVNGRWASAAKVPDPVAVAPASTKARRPVPQQPGSVRDITIPGLTRVERTGPPMRMESLEDSDAAPDRVRRYPRVLVTHAGRFTAGEARVRLYGIAAPELDQTCRSVSGESWACGQRAAAALRALIRSRAVECEPKAEADREILGICLVGRTDLSAWLLRQGWAELADGVGEPAYAEALTAAKHEKLGLWSERPDGSGSSARP